jgi:hypothetical protein
MRSKCRLAVIVTMLAVVFTLPSSAAAQIDQLSLSRDVQLGPEGASATTFVTVQCAEGFIGDVFVNIVQNNGGRLASGGGGASVTCTGASQALTAPVGFSIFALKQGKATGTATLNVFDPVTFEGFSATTGPVPVRVHK